MGAASTPIAVNLMRVNDQIARAAARSGRRPEEITLVAVSKTFPAEAIRAAYSAGVRHFGENRVQEWSAKRPLLADLAATWHLVGHLQSNKARRAAGLFHMIDSLDSISLAQKLDSAIAVATRRLPVLIEVRLVPEEGKTGVEESELEKLAEAVLKLPHLELHGLMTIPPFFDDLEKVRPFFRRLRELRDDLRRWLSSAGHSDPDSSGPEIGESVLSELSMGMSHDFEIAIEEGATQVRLGTALFGPRQPP